MNAAQQQLIQLYLNNLEVKVAAVGYNQVWTDWRDIDYTPDFNKFYLICDGEGWLKIGDTEFRPKPGQWFVMPQGVKQSYSFTDGPRYTKYWCHFTATIGQQNLFDLLDTPFYIDTDSDPEAALRFQELLTCRSSAASTSPLLLKASMLKLISYYLEHAGFSISGSGNSAGSASLQAAIEYIGTHFRRNITITELAELTHLHPNYFIRVFKRHFGVSPIQFINQKRIEEAKWLLLSTSLHLSEISEMIGISDVSYLSRLFKALTGFSPTAYRLEHRVF